MKVLLKSYVGLGRKLCLEGVLRFRINLHLAVLHSKYIIWGNQERTAHGTVWLKGARNWPTFKYVSYETEESPGRPVVKTQWFHYCGPRFNPWIMASGPITSWQVDGETMETVRDFIFLGSKITADDDYSPEIKRYLLLGRKAMRNLDTVLKGRDVTLPAKVHIVKSYGFSNGHVWMWELDHKEGWALKNWCFQTVVLEKTLESPLDCKEIKPVNPKGNESWIFFGRTDAEAETPILWPPGVKNWLTGKIPDAGKDWKAGGEGDDRGQDCWMVSPTQWTWVWASSRWWWRTGSLEFCSPRGCKEWAWLSDWTATYEIIRDLLSELYVYEFGSRLFWLHMTDTQF